MNLAVDLALWEVLTGAPLDGEGRPRRDSNGVPVNRSLVGFPYSQPTVEDEENGITSGPVRRPSYGIRVPNLRGGKQWSSVALPNNRGISGTFNPSKDLEAMSFRQVPVFPLNVEGVNIADIYPCVTFHLGEDQHDASRYLFWDPISVEASVRGEASVEFSDNEVGTGPTRLGFRVHPRTDNLTYRVRVYSRNEVEFRLICDQVKYLLPPRGSIEVQQYDGTTLPSNVILIGSINLNTGGPDLRRGLDGVSRGEFCQEYSYRIEVTDDNTSNKYGKNDIFESDAIRERYLELRQIQLSSAGITTSPTTVVKEV